MPYGVPPLSRGIARRALPRCVPITSPVPSLALLEYPPSSYRGALLIGLSSVLAAIPARERRYDRAARSSYRRAMRPNWPARGKKVRLGSNTKSVHEGRSERERGREDARDRLRGKIRHFGRLIKCSHKHSRARIRALLRRRISRRLIYATAEWGADYFRGVYGGEEEEAIARSQP